MTTPDQQTFRDAMACVGAAVNIITTDGPAGMAGFTASAVCSVTDSPPTLLVCLNRGASVWPIFSENRTLCVNTLSAGQEPLSNLFGGKTPMAERFAAARWQTGDTGCPRLENATASFDCRISRWLASAPTTFCFATSYPSFATRHRKGWCGSTAAITHLCDPPVNPHSGDRTCSDFPTGS